MELVLSEWVSAILRWLHVIAGIAWIGSSFYFIHLDLSLRPRPGLPAGVKGDEWQVHGGGFYHMMKYLVAPAQMPDSLTWFKWEAYTTWLSGFSLLVLVYYLGADIFLIDKSVLDLTATQAASIAFVSLAVSWLAYEGAVPVAAGAARGGDGGGRLCLSGRADLRLHSRFQRARRLHADRRAHRHDHGGERFRHHHSVSKEDGRGDARRQGARPGLGRDRQAALGAQQLSDAARRVSDAQQSLPAAVCDAVQLADRRDRAVDRTRSSAISTIRATRAKAARGGPGAWPPPAWRRSRGSRLPVRPR